MFALLSMTMLCPKPPAFWTPEWEKNDWEKLHGKTPSCYADQGKPANS
jgi:hypothetical protein